MSVPDMADPCAELQAAIITVLRADAAVAAAFSPEAVRICDTPTTNEAKNYVVVGHMQPLPLGATDAADVEVTLHVWSLTSPPGKAKATAIGKAAMAACLALPDTTGFFVKSTRATSAQYLTDPGDGLTAHGIVKFDVTTQPKP
jgi:hypothetical protein